jgi:hypothetical protein
MTDLRMKKARYIQILEEQITLTYARLAQDSRLDEGYEVIREDGLIKISLHLLKADLEKRGYLDGSKAARSAFFRAKIGLLHDGTLVELGGCIWNPNP